MKHYRELTKSNAASFLQDYIGQKDVGLEYLKNCLSENGFDMALLDYSPESLIPIWELLHSKIEFFTDSPDYEAHLDELPIWILLNLGFHGEDFGGYSFETIKIIDGLAYYFAEVFLRNNEGTHWDVCPWTDPNTVGANEPVIRLRVKGVCIHAFVPPLTPVGSGALKTWLYKEDFSESNLYDDYNQIVQMHINTIPPEPPVSEFKDSYPTLENELKDHDIYELEELVEIEILGKEDRLSSSSKCNTFGFK